MSSLERYWHDAEYRARKDAEYSKTRALINNNIDDAKMANGSRWPNDWTDSEKQEANNALITKRIVS